MTAARTASPAEDVLDETDDASNEAVGRTVFTGKQRLLVDRANPDRTVAELRDIHSHVGLFYDRGVPVRMAAEQASRGVVAQVVNPDALVLLSHQVCRPYSLKMKDGVLMEVDVELPRKMAAMHLAWEGEWQLKPMNGIASAPLLFDDGSIVSGEGYDATLGLWLERVPDLRALVPARPSFQDAERALRTIRSQFRTFCFADAETICDSAAGTAVVDIREPPGRDKSAFLNGLLTAICRPSLWLAPGLLLRAPPLSGAGTGKGLLARSICRIAYGREPHAVTRGASAEELEKRISAELMQASLALFLDNFNNTALRSDLLASAMTERPSRVRVLGLSKMVTLNASAFVVVTGNGLSVSEDLARRFITVDLDARREDPETRSFQVDIKADIVRRRSKLLAAALTILRWGRQQAGLTAGKPFGSFEQWSRWVRDPLLALGCKDPVERVAEAKTRDIQRQKIADLFATWWERHGEFPVTVANLHDDVKKIADPQGKGRQFLAAYIGNLTDTRVNGFLLTRQEPSGKWPAATYALKRTESSEAEEHRSHRGRRGVNHPNDTANPSNKESAQPPGSPMPPMPPMPQEDDENPEAVPPWRARMPL